MLSAVRRRSSGPCWRPCRACRRARRSCRCRWPPGRTRRRPARARELALRARVAAAYGATHLMVDGAAPAAADLPPGADLAASARIPLVPSGDWAYDPRAEVWRPHALIEAGQEREDLSADQLGDLLDAGSEIPHWVVPAAVARELRRVRRPRSERGLVLFLTGLSGSGKSTIASDLADMLAERSDRQVSLLDGDLVRQLLSAGLRSPAPTATSTSPDRLRRGRDRPARRHRDLRAHRAVRGSAGAGQADGQRGRRLLPDPRRHAGRGLRGARPEGPVRQGQGRADRPVHRRFRPLRGACRRGAGHRHLGHEPGRGRAGGAGAC